MASQVVRAELALRVGRHVVVGGGDRASIYCLVSYIELIAAALKQDRRASYF